MWFLRSDNAKVKIKPKKWDEKLPGNDTNAKKIIFSWKRRDEREEGRN